MTTDKKTEGPNQEQKIWAAASYLWILSLVVLAARKETAFIRAHANQGVLMFLLSVVFMILGPVGIVLNIILAVLAVAGIVKALHGEAWKAPVVGGFAEQFGAWVVKILKL